MKQSVILEPEQYNCIDAANEKVLLVRYRLQFFASAEGPGGEKTEEATPKKLEDARKKGQVAKSHELITACGLLALFMSLKLFVGYMGNSFVDTFNENYSAIETYAKDIFTSNYATAFLQEAMLNIVVICLPIFAIAIVVSFFVNAMQVRWQPTIETLKPKFEKINPLSGFKRMFSLDKVVELVKSLLKIGVIVYLAYSTLNDEKDNLNIIYGIELNAAVMLIGNIAINLGLKISAFFIAIGLFDYLYQRFKFMRDMRMTKQEIKDEFKQSEGDPKIKGQIRQKMREASQRRMMQKLPEADVVITNPTHLACAIKYDKEIAEAPVLIAKGADYLAGRIRERAKEYNIPIVENKPLARMLYHNVDLEEQIPQELFQMTAEVLAYVYSLKNK